MQWIEVDFWFGYDVFFGFFDVVVELFEDQFVFDYCGGGGKFVGVDIVFVVWCDIDVVWVFWYWYVVGQCCFWIFVGFMGVIYYWYFGGVDSDVFVGFDGGFDVFDIEEDVSIVFG